MADPRLTYAVISNTLHYCNSLFVALKAGFFLLDMLLLPKEESGLPNGRAVVICLAVHLCDDPQHRLPASYSRTSEASLFTNLCSLVVYSTVHEPGML